MAKIHFRLTWCEDSLRFGNHQLQSSNSSTTSPVPRASNRIWTVVHFLHRHRVSLSQFRWITQLLPLNFTARVPFKISRQKAFNNDPRILSVSSASILLTLILFPLQTERGVARNMLRLVSVCVLLVQ